MNLRSRLKQANLSPDDILAYVVIGGAIIYFTLSYLLR